MRLGLNTLFRLMRDYWALHCCLFFGNCNNRPMGEETSGAEFSINIIK
jgi:hypothetical protein